MTDGRVAADTVEDGPTPAAGADPARCGCAGKTPLSRTVVPARERVAARLVGTSVELGPDVDAAVLPGSERIEVIERDAETVGLDGDDPPRVPFGGGPGYGGSRPTGDGTGRSSDNRDDGPVVTVACCFLGDDVADPDRLGPALADAYAALDGPEVRIGKGHAVQVPGASGGRLWLEHLRPAVGVAVDEAEGVDEADEAEESNGAGDVSGSNGAVTAANVDAVHAFPLLPPAEQARIAALNALNDVHTVRATRNRTVRPLVATPADERPDPGRVTAWYREGVPDDVRVLPASVLDHDGDGWLLGASVTASGPGSTDESGGPVDREGASATRLPDDCGVLLTRPLGALASFAHGVVVGDDDLCERGLAHLRRDTRGSADALVEFSPRPGERGDPEAHIARVTDVSGEGVAGLGRLVDSVGRSIRLRRLPLISGAEEAASAWTVPDVTVETTGPLAVFAAPAVLERVRDRLGPVDGADPCRIGRVAADGPPLVDETGGELSEVIEEAGRWPTADGAGDGAPGDDDGGAADG